MANVIGFQPGHDHIKMLTYTLILAGRPKLGYMWIHFGVDSQAYIRRTHAWSLKKKSVAQGWDFVKMDVEVASRP